MPINENSAHLVFQVAEIQKKVDKHHTDLYEGDGPENPPITMRLDRQEKLSEDRQKREDRTHAYAVSAFLLLLATFLTLIGNLVAKHL